MREPTSLGMLARVTPMFTAASVSSYFMLVGFGFSPFYYYPQVGHFHRLKHDGIGPPMAYYGWLLSAAFIGLLASLVYALLPLRVHVFVIRHLAWLLIVLPVSALICILLLLRNYFGYPV